jgi:hypothetical protein
MSIYTDMTLADDFRTQNKFLQDLIEKYSSGSAKSYYLNEQNYTINSINSFLFWIFMIVAILFVASVFMSPVMNSVSIYFKIIIGILVFAYPFYIHIVELFILQWSQYLYDMVLGNRYLAPHF